MKTVSTLLAFLLLVSGLATAQNAPGGGPAARPAGQLSGSVVDGESRTPLPSATVSVWTPTDSSLVTGVITRQDGTFLVEQLRPGRYYVKISFVGYATRSLNDVEVTPQAAAVDLGRVALEADAQQLADVEVTAERAAVQFSIDRTVYNVKDQPVSTGGSATDVLKNLPSVEVDQDGKVSLRGSQNVAIQINGRPAPMSGEFLASYLQQLNAGMIDRVEVIPNPSAKYDPEGMAGILNIVLKENQDMGASGGVTLSGGSGDKYNASTNVGYQQGPLNVYASYGYRNEHRANEGFSSRANRLSETTALLEQDMTGLNQMASHMVNATIDYSLSRQNTLSLTTLLSRNDDRNNNLNAYTAFTPDGSLAGQYDLNTLGTRGGSNTNATLSFRRVMESMKHEFSSSLRYNVSRNAMLNTYQASIFTGSGVQQTDQDMENRDLDLQLDYTRTLGGLKLETGYKGTLRRMDSGFFSETADSLGVYRPDTGRINDFRYDEQVNAGYGILSQSLGKLDLQGGLRFEQARTTFDLLTTDTAYDNAYTSLFPSAIAAYKFSPTSQLKLSYSKRIQRPNTFQLNPFGFSEDPLNRFVGNPGLRPEYIHAYELSFQQFTNWGSVSVTPFFRRTTDVMRFFRTIDPATNVQTVSFRNLDMSDSYGAEVVSSYKLGQKLSGFVSFNGNQVVTDGSSVESGLGSNAFSWSTRLNASYQITPGLDVQGFYFYRAPMQVEDGRISAFTMANVALRKKVLDDRGSLSLRLEDPFNTMRFQIASESPDYALNMRRKRESRIAVLSFTFNVGQQPRSRTRGAERPNGGEMQGGGDGIGIMQ